MILEAPQPARDLLLPLSTKEIAVALGISPYTVQERFTAIFDTVGMRSRRELVGRTFRHCQGGTTPGATPRRAAPAVGTRRGLAAG